MSRLAAEVAFHSSLLTPRLLLQVIVESDFSLPTFASCLFRLRGDSKAIAGVSKFVARGVRCLMPFASVPCSAVPGMQGQVIVGTSIAAAIAVIRLTTPADRAPVPQRPPAENTAAALEHEHIPAVLVGKGGRR